VSQGPRAEILPCWELSRRFWDKSHTPMIPGSGTSVDLGCIFCDSVEVFTTPWGLVGHLQARGFHKDGSDFSSDFKNDCDISAL